MLLLTGTTYANNWYNTGNPLNVKPLLFGGIATLILSAFAALPGQEKTATAIGWLAFIGYMVGAESVVKGKLVNNSPITNLNNIISGKGK